MRISQSPSQGAKLQQPALPTVPNLPVSVSGGEMSGADFQALRMKMRELNQELQTAAERRNSIAERLKEADPLAKTGYQQRLQVLDSRIIAMEQELDAASRQLAAAPASAVVAGSQQDPGPGLILERVANEIVPIVGILTVFVLAPFTLAISRFLWKRASHPARQVTDGATLQKIEQLQQAVDTIAVEVERISEGQRYVTRLMSPAASEVSRER